MILALLGNIIPNNIIKKLIKITLIIFEKYNQCLSKNNSLFVKDKKDLS
jgi:hypothetical protein